MQFIFRRLLGEVLLGAWWLRAGEGESGHPGAWQTTLQILRPFGETLASLLVRTPFLDARGLLAGVDLSFLFKVMAFQSMIAVVRCGAYRHGPVRLRAHLPILVSSHREGGGPCWDVGEHA
eukprot:1161879-Pelagomonas_calceolata.AAC.6